MYDGLVDWVYIPDKKLRCEVDRWSMVEFCGEPDFDTWVGAQCNSGAYHEFIVAKRYDTSDAVRPIKHRWWKERISVVVGTKPKIVWELQKVGIRMRSRRLVNSDERALSYARTTEAWDRADAAISMGVLSVDEARSAVLHAFNNPVRRSGIVSKTIPQADVRVCGIRLDAVTYGQVRQRGADWLRRVIREAIKEGR